jgi:hypothetical protein
VLAAIPGTFRLAHPAAAVIAALAGVTARQTRRWPIAAGQPQTGECHAGQAEAEFFDGLASGDGLSHAYGQFIELIDSHTVSFLFFWFVLVRQPSASLLNRTSQRPAA